MSGRRFDSAENADLHAKIDQAKQRLPLPALMARPEIGLAAHAKKEARCPWHSDEHPSFSVFKKADGTWWHKCFVGCCEGDEIALLVKHFNISRRDAIKRYLDMAGFPPRRPFKSHECPESSAFPESHGSPECPASPVSNGQESPDIVTALAARNACRKRGTASKALFQLVRHLRTVENCGGEEAEVAWLTPFFDEWYRLSEPFLDPGKTRDHYIAEFVAGFRKVRVFIGEGDTLNKALKAVEKLSPPQLPVIPKMPNAPQSWRRVAALHRELSRLCVANIYFLSYRDAAKACDGLSYQSAHTITGALARLRVIEIVRHGKAGLNSGKAAEFRYLLAQTENGAEDDEGFEL